MPYRMQRHGGSSSQQSGSQQSGWSQQAPSWVTQPPSGYMHGTAELWFIYNFPDQTISANGTGSPSIQILSDADFICTWLNYHSTGKFTVLIQDASSSQAFMNNAVNAADFMGNGQNPAPMLPPYRFAANHVISFNLTDTSGAQNVIGISLVGRKVFGQAGQQSSQGNGQFSS
jgi:hypothetical protein